MKSISMQFIILNQFKYTFFMQRRAQNFSASLQRFVAI